MVTTELHDSGNELKDHDFFLAAALRVDKAVRRPQLVAVGARAEEASASAREADIAMSLHSRIRTMHTGLQTCSSTQTPGLRCQNRCKNIQWCSSRYDMMQQEERCSTFINWPQKRAVLFERRVKKFRISDLRRPRQRRLMCGSYGHFGRDDICCV